MRRNLAAAWLLVSVFGSLAAAEPQATATPPTIDDTAQAGEADALEPPRELLKWNEADFGVTTFRFGFGLLTDFVHTEQDTESEQQIAIADPTDVGLRDLRVLFRGKAKTKRPLSWTMGYMYDGVDGEWRFRQTGIEIGLPEVKGRVFIGRTKEGYSMVKVMVGYHPWMIERSPGLDAFVPILADGVKYMGYYPKSGLFLNFGVFGDWGWENAKFATYDHQIVARLGWRPILSETDGRVLHLAVMGREARPDEGSFQVRSRPESYLSPYFLDTGKFASDHARTTGVEAYWRSGPWLAGGEYDWQQMDADDTGEKPMFHAGDAVVSWLITGETRPYNAPGGFFGPISPARTVFDGGLGAWEAVLHFSYADFDDDSFQGGKLWRITPMVNWHLSDNLRFELVYGYAELDRFGLEGHTQFFQSRLQITL
jgi:phosphate-selective porin OprO/OprP